VGGHLGRGSTSSSSSAPVTGEAAAQQLESLD
jgi:hypothetical protein